MRTVANASTSGRSLSKICPQTLSQGTRQRPPRPNCAWASAASALAPAAGVGCYRPCASTSRRSSIAVMASHTPFPFNESNYHRVSFVDEPYGPMKIYQDPRAHVQFTGVLVFKRNTDVDIHKNLKIMEVFVAGDTAVNIYTLVSNLKLERPMVHDVMFSIMQQAQVGDPRRWGLLKVAIVGLQDDVFVGRLFFGDTLTQTVHWDCDCRPSDGCFLSIKCNAPLYIHRTVWDAASKPLEDSTVFQMLHENSPTAAGANSAVLPPPPPQQASGPASPHGKESVASAAESPVIDVVATVQPAAVSNDYMTLMQDDLEAIKLLKRKLALAIHEEDYQSAAHIRDHPYMQLYKELKISRMMGRHADAARIELELKAQIETNTLSQEPKF